MAIPQRTEKVGDVARVQSRRRNLIEQRLEHVVDVAVNQKDVDVCLAELLYGGDTSEPASDDHHFGAMLMLRTVSHTIPTSRRIRGS